MAFPAEVIETAFFRAGEGRSILIENLAGVMVDPKNLHKIRRVIIFHAGKSSAIVLHLSEIQRGAVEFPTIGILVDALQKERDFVGVFAHIDVVGDAISLSAIDKGEGIDFVSGIRLEEILANHVNGRHDQHYGDGG